MRTSIPGIDVILLWWMLLLLLPLFLSSSLFFSFRLFSFPFLFYSLEARHRGGGDNGSSTIGSSDAGNDDDPA